MTAILVAEGGPPSGDPRRGAVRWPVQVVMAIASVAVGFVGGVLVRDLRSRGAAHDVTVIEGTAFAGSHQVALNAGEWHRVAGPPLSGFYKSLGWDVTGARWEDPGGGLHQGGIPSCVRVGNHPRVEVGVLEAKGHGSETGDVALVWLKCLSS